MPRERKQGAEDDRQGDGQRDRIDELVANTERWRLDMDKRWRRVARLLTVMMVAVVVAVTVGYLVLQGDRWQATRDSCLRTNASSEAVVGLLVELGSPPKVVDAAKRRFPHTPPLNIDDLKAYQGARSCSEQATIAIRGPKL